MMPSPPRPASFRLPPHNPDFRLGFAGGPFVRERGNDDRGQPGRQRAPPRHFSPGAERVRIDVPAGPPGHPVPGHAVVRLRREDQAGRPRGPAEAGVGAASGRSVVLRTSFAYSPSPVHGRSWLTRLFRSTFSLYRLPILSRDQRKIQTHFEPVLHLTMKSICFVELPSCVLIFRFDISDIEQEEHSKI